jgi:DNA-binding transcriptional LysR family regulator
MIARAGAESSGSHTRWQAIEVRHLAALAAIAREGSFRRAADRLGYVQSAISGQIAHLEKAAGTRLVDRAAGTPTVALTPAGRTLLIHTDEILARLEAAHADVSSLATRAAESVRVAGMEQFSPRRIARVLRSFRERYPLRRVILEGAGDEQSSAEQLAGGRIDLLVTDLPVPPGPFGHSVLEEDPFLLLTRRDADLIAEDQPLDAGKLASRDLIIPAVGKVFDEADARLRELGITRRAKVRPDSIATAQALARTGLGDVIAPASLIDAADPDLVALELAGALPPRIMAVAFCAERDRTPVVQGFVRTIRVAIDAEHAVATSIALPSPVRRRPQGSNGAPTHARLASAGVEPLARCS